MHGEQTFETRTVTAVLNSDDTSTSWRLFRKLNTDIYRVAAVCWRFPCSIYAAPFYSLLYVQE